MMLPLPRPHPEETAEEAEHPANRLASETSPYLLMHAHNPVDWYPWGPEALEKAKKEKQADLSLHRLQQLLLVPCDGAGVVHERRDRRVHQRAFRLHQGRPRGAARHRRDLHDALQVYLQASGRRRRRLAAVDVPDARRQADRRRHVLPAARTMRRADRVSERAASTVARGLDDDREDDPQ